MAKYVEIKKSEFEKELRLIEKELGLAYPFQILPLDDTAEYVYAARVLSPTKPKRPLTLRIYSTVVDFSARGPSKARDVGQDAIRVNVMTFSRLIRNPAWIANEEQTPYSGPDHGGVEWIPERIYPAIKGKRVHRVEGWRKNLRTRIQQVIKEIY